jgi:hypothetical protein
MTHTMYCKDLGFDCEGVVRPETEEEAMQMVANMPMMFTELMKSPLRFLYKLIM